MNTISAEELKLKLDKGEIILIDVRTSLEHEIERIEGAKLMTDICYDDIKDMTKPIVLHCKSGTRSANAVEKILKENSNVDIKTLDGGIEAYAKSGFSTIKSKQNILSLERQTQIAIGLIIITSMLLGFIFTKKLYFLTFFVGLGLVFAGISGTCFLGILISKAPWNKPK
jgi:rhodanese-related sulfurtransferase